VPQTVLDALYMSFVPQNSPKRTEDMFAQKFEINVYNSIIYNRSKEKTIQMPIS
jgi:hypothetical protein